MQFLAYRVGMVGGHVRFLEGTGILRIESGGGIDRFTADTLIGTFGDQAFFQGMRLGTDALRIGDRPAARDLRDAMIELIARGYHLCEERPHGFLPPLLHDTELYAWLSEPIAVDSRRMVLAGAVSVTDGPIREVPPLRELRRESMPGLRLYLCRFRFDRVLAEA